MRVYEESLKAYRDNYSAIKTAKKEGVAERELDIARAMKNYVDRMEKIAMITGLIKRANRKVVESPPGSLGQSVAPRTMPTHYDESQGYESI